jgi:hypothetical protein
MNSIQNIKDQDTEEGTLEYWKDRATNLERLFQAQSKAMGEYLKNLPPEPEFDFSNIDDLSKLNEFLLSLQNWGREGWSYAASLQTKND